jgi:hypothetical protein
MMFQPDVASFVSLRECFDPDRIECVQYEVLSGFGAGFRFRSEKEVCAPYFLVKLELLDNVLLARSKNAILDC